MKTMQNCTNKICTECSVNFRDHNRCKYCTKLDHYCKGECLGRIISTTKFVCARCSEPIENLSNDYNIKLKVERGNMCYKCSQFFNAVIAVKLKKLKELKTNK